MYFHQSLWRSERSRELKYNCIKTCRATYMDVAFPYKEAITNAYGQPAHVQQQHMWPAIYTLEEKAKG